MKYKIGIISDTHNVLRAEVVDDLKTCDYILHAGDIMKVEVLEALQQIAPVIAVKGNNDQLELGVEKYFEIGSYHFYMVHQLGKKQDVDFYIFDSHKMKLKSIKAILKQTTHQLAKHYFYKDIDNVKIIIEKKVGGIGFGPMNYYNDDLSV